MEYFRILVELGTISDGQIVTKRNGDQEYTVKDRIRIFGEPPIPDIIADPGVKFLVNERGQIQALPGSTLVIWKIYRTHLYDLLRKTE